MDLANPAITLGVSVAAILCAAAWVVRNSSAARAREQQAALEAAARAREQQAALEAATARITALEARAATSATRFAAFEKRAEAAQLQLQQEAAVHRFEVKAQASRAALEAFVAWMREEQTARHWIQVEEMRDVRELRKEAAAQLQLQQGAAVEAAAREQQRIATKVHTLRFTFAELMGAPQQRTTCLNSLGGGGPSRSCGGSADLEGLPGAAGGSGAAGTGKNVRRKLGSSSANGTSDAGEGGNNARSTDSGMKTEAGSVDLAKLFKPSCSGVFELEGVQSGTRAHLVKKEFVKFFEECTSVALCKELDAVRSLLRGNVRGPGVGVGVGGALNKMSERNLLHLVKSLEMSMDNFDLVFEPMLPDEIAKAASEGRTGAAQGPYYAHWRVRVLRADATIDLLRKANGERAEAPEGCSSEHTKALTDIDDDIVVFDTDRVSLRALFVTYFYGLVRQQGWVCDSTGGIKTMSAVERNATLIEGLQRGLDWLNAYDAMTSQQSQNDKAGPSMQLINSWFESLQNPCRVVG